MTTRMRSMLSPAFFGLAIPNAPVQLLDLGDGSADGVKVPADQHFDVRVFSLQTQSNLTRDHQEAVRAFGEARRPGFAGR